MWKPLSEGDIVDIIAPSSGLSLERLQKSQEFLKEWGLVPRVSPDIFGPDILYANSDALRFLDLKRALYANDSKAIWCIRGGSGSTRLIPKLEEMAPPRLEKLFIGFSDITCLQIYMHQRWNWSPIHGPSLSQVAEGTISPESIKTIKDIVFGYIKHMERTNLIPLNKASKKNGVIKSLSIGGNASLIQCSIGTLWEIKASGKVLFLEEANERPYRLAERLEHFRQALIFHECAAIILGDFIAPEEHAIEQDLMPNILQNFADKMEIPVFSCSGIGHGKINISFPIGMPCILDLGANVLLRCSFP